MTLGKWPSRVDAAMILSGSETIADHRARIASLHDAVLERRRLEAAEQASASNAPDQRIRIWERIHELRLPTDPAHPLVKVIAARTNLTVEQVREEQQRRLSLGQPMTRSAESLSWNSGPIR